jgi:hypothetical protein
LKVGWGDCGVDAMGITKAVELGSNHNVRKGKPGDRPIIINSIHWKHVKSLGNNRGSIAITELSR